MNAEFWLGILDLSTLAQASGSMAEPLLSSDIRYVGIEVLRIPGTNDVGVLFSRAQDANTPVDLDCRIGFTNVAAACTLWRDRGFPLVDAVITLDGAGMLEVRAAYYSKYVGPQADAPPLVRLGPISFPPNAADAANTATTVGTPGTANTLAFNVTYRQAEQAPDPARPATVVRRRALQWSGTHSSVNALGKPQLRFAMADARSPSLKPLDTATVTLAAAWSGAVAIPAHPSTTASTTQIVPRVDAFGVPAFRFEDVEALGFRIDVPCDALARDELRELVDPLNFHRGFGDLSQVPDFRYEPLGASIVIELLRYGRMQLLRQDAPLTMGDYQSQHELVVRMVVGRIDDDSTNARNEAVFIPAIFVDNAWSKIVGRDLQGIPKTLAAFCVDAPGGPAALQRDGRLGPGGSVRPLRDISSIRLRDRLGGLPAGELMSFQFDPGEDRGWDNFKSVAPGPVIAGLSLGEAAWRWFDVSRLSSLASFLWRATGQLFNGFSSVQSTPLGKLDLDSAWVNGRFQIDDLVDLAFPFGTVRLAFNDPPDAPPKWSTLCKLLQDEPSYDLHFSSWYRLKFSMTMSVEDGLAWDD